MDFLSTDERTKDLTLYVAMMSVLRCVSFGLEYCWRVHERQEDEQPEMYSLLDLLVFNFYFPVFVNGPVITFETFQKTVSSVECLWSTSAVREACYWNISLRVQLCVYKIKTTV